MRRTILAATCVLAGLLQQGCNEHYHLELAAKGEKMDRRLSAYHLKGDPPKIEQATQRNLGALLQLYNNKYEIGQAGELVFHTTVQERWTNIEGGHAEYLRLVSDLGTVSHYSENLSGNSDLAEDLQKCMETEDSLTDIIKEWFEQELKDEPKKDVLLGWIDKDLRRCLRNVAVYMRVAKAGNPQRHGIDDAHVLLLNYLLEHGYLTRKDLTALVRGVRNLESAEGERAFFAWLQRFTAQKMGVPDDQAIPESLAFLGSRAKLTTSATSYIYKTGAYKNLLKRRETNPKNENSLTSENPSEALTTMIMLILYTIDPEIAGLGKYEKWDWSVTLALPVMPILTNGTWDAEKKLVRWGDPKKAGEGVRFVHAVWAEPSERQTVRFGKVLLDGAHLGAYALWFQALHENERAEWTAFVDTIKPGDDVAKALEGFRFKGEKGLDEKEVKPALSNAVREIFREALAPEEPEHPKQQ